MTSIRASSIERVNVLFRLSISSKYKAADPFLPVHFVGVRIMPLVPGRIDTSHNNRPALVNQNMSIQIVTSMLSLAATRATYLLTMWFHQQRRTIHRRIAADLRCGSFRWSDVAGLRRREQLLTSQIAKHSPGGQFCSVCSSTLRGLYDGDVHGGTLGCLNGDPDVELNMHVLVGSKVKRETIAEGISGTRNGHRISPKPITTTGSHRCF